MTCPETLHVDGVTATLNLGEVAEPLLLGPDRCKAQELGAEYAVNKPSTLSQSLRKTLTVAFSLLKNLLRHKTGYLNMVSRHESGTLTKGS